MGSEAKVLTRDNALQIAHWCNGRMVVEEDALSSDIKTPGINLRVSSGEIQRASMGDTIIRKNDGTFEIFKNI
jgi:hypothetical protein